MPIPEFDFSSLLKLNIHVLAFKMIKPYLDLSSKGWVMKEILNNVQHMWVTLIWVSNNYFAWEVILDIEIWINDCEDENEKYMNEWIYLSLCMCNFEKKNEYFECNFGMNESYWLWN
jgi:hypothetical protein